MISLFSGLSLFFLLMGLLYCYIVIKVIINWGKIKVFHKTDSNLSTTVSIIVAARNEKENILNCLTSLVAQKYSKAYFEIIVVDDYSTDDTADLVQTFIAKNTTVAIKLIRVADLKISGLGKKNAIKIGIESSIAKLIATTDADCTMGEHWLESIVSYYEKHQPKMIIGPVAIKNETTTIEILQNLELQSLMGFTGAYCFLNQPIMSNGANFIYEREAFNTVNGFDGIEKTASGDDVLLMNKFEMKFLKKIHFLKVQDAIVFTKAQSTLKGFLNQRKRWTSKNIKNISRTSVFVGVVIGSMNISIILNLILSIFYDKLACTFLILFFLKFIVDYMLLKKVSPFFKKKIYPTQVLISQLIYSFCIVVLFFLGVRRKYEWKGRTVK